MNAARLLGLLLLPLTVQAVAPVAVHWLDGAAPPVADGVTWGVPWPQGAVQANDPLALQDRAGHSIPVQSWPLAYWPDGSLKWTGHAVAADAALPAELTIGPGQPAAPRHPLAVDETVDDITIHTGGFVARLPKHGPDLIASLATKVGEVARHGRLLAIREDRSRWASQHLLGEEDYTSEIDSAVVEQAGPVRAVVKFTGRHRRDGGGRSWLPFVVRLAFFADSNAIRLTHTFVFDGDAPRDFIRGLGLAFDVPLREELQNRHLRFAGDATGGVWVQPVRMLPGYRSQAGRETADLYDDTLRGERIPNLDQLDGRTRGALLTVPVWGDARLTQLSPNGWSIAKRTSADASWLHVTDGRRALGLALVGDVSGGLAVGVKDFWQKAPTSLEITDAAGSAAALKIWLWSPEAEPMDLRRYDEVPHGLPVNYEDWKPGWGTPYGIANTHDLTLWVLDAIPSDQAVIAMARLAAQPPQLVCSPEYYHAQHALGAWSLPDRSTPASAWVEDQVSGLLDFYQQQVDERSWYGFWDFGDIMHNYDYGRHQWRYDVGGWAWANTELMPDMLWWYSFLRTGRADLFRFAAAMTRHTSEVDVYHLGPFAPLGSRHNVNHWGDGAKQPRISHAGLKRFYYFLSGGDGRLGDLLKEQIDADLTYAYLRQFDRSHYVPNADGTPRLESGQNPFRAAGPPPSPAPRPEQFGPRPTAADRQPDTHFDLQWMCYALNWTTEWERGGDQHWRGWVTAEMQAMAKDVDASGKFPGRYFDMIFGGPENMWQMEPMYDVPSFWSAWVNTCEAIGRATGGNEMTAPRMLAYAAARKHSPELGRLAWEQLIGPPGQLPSPMKPNPVRSPELPRRATDPDFLGRSVQWQQHGVASVQWALNAIETLEFARPYLNEWEQPAAPPAPSR